MLNEYIAAHPPATNHSISTSGEEDPWRFLIEGAQRMRDQVSCTLYLRIHRNADLYNDSDSEDPSVPHLKMKAEEDCTVVT